jgi:hypothetical protein
MNRVLEAMRKVEEVRIRLVSLQADRMKTMTVLSYLNGRREGGPSEQ